MSPQCEDGYTKIANELLEALCTIRIPGESMQIFLMILRKTYGFGKKLDRIALSQFVDATGIKKPNIIRAVKQLSEMNIIVIKKDNATITSYGINKHYMTWKALSKKITLSKKIKDVIKKDNPPLSKKIPTKETTTKEKKERLPICEAWKSYLDMRVKIKKPMTDRGKVLAVGKLKELQVQGHDPTDVLNQSVFNSWQGLFPVKSQTQTVVAKIEPTQTIDDLRAKGLIE